MANHPTVDHPLYRMWKERYAAELQPQAELLVRAAARQAAQREWREAWESYRLHWAAAKASTPRWRWWHGFQAWLLPQSGAADQWSGDGQGTPNLDN
jgi:hypothetical protein